MRANLTLNLGLRYELPTPWVDKFDRINTVVPDASVRSQKIPTAPPGMLFPGDLPRGLYNTDKNNFAPRFGFAWDVSGDGRTAVRAAYGIFYDTFNTDTIAQENPPFVGGGRTFVNGLMSNPFGSVGAVAPPAFIDPDAFTFVYPINGFWSGIGEDSLRTTYVQEWNLTIAQELGRDYALSAAYIGKTGRKIIAFRPFNAAPFIPGNNAQGLPISTEGNAESRAPFLPGIYGTEGIFLDNSFTSAYHSVQIEVNKRFSGGLQFNSSYTLGKSIDSSSTTNLGGCLANPFDVRDDRGRSSWDRRHAFVVSGIWTLPAYASQQGAARKTAGGMERFRYFVHSERKSGHDHNRSEHSLGWKHLRWGRLACRYRGQSGAIAFLARRHGGTVLRPRCLRFAADRAVWKRRPRACFRDRPWSRPTWPY